MLLLFIAVYSLLLGLLKSVFRNKENKWAGVSGALSIENFSVLKLALNVWSDLSSCLLKLLN